MAFFQDQDAQPVAGKFARSGAADASRADDDDIKHAFVSIAAKTEM